MKKSFFVPVLAAVLLLSACGAETPAGHSKTESLQAAASENNEELLALQAEYDRACSLLEAGELDEAESILLPLEAELPEAKEKLLEIRNLKLLQSYAGNWVNTDFSGMDLCLAADGTGMLQSSEEQAEFTFSAAAAGIQTDHEQIPELKLSTENSVRTLTAEGITFFSQADVQALPEPEKIEITAENWEEYFEIVTSCFAKSYGDDGDPSYACDILYFYPKAEIRERMSPFHSFQVAFSASYDRTLYYVGVDHETFQPLGKAGIPTRLGHDDSSCKLDNQALWRIETDNFLYSDGFAHESLRDGAYIRYSRYWEVAENIKVTNVEGFLLLCQSNAAE